MPAEPFTIRLQPYFRDLRTVQVVIGGDTLRMLFDTGGGHTLLSLASASTLGCSPSGRSVGYRMTGERVEFRWCPAQSLAVGSHRLDAIPLAVFDLGAVLPSELPAVDGLLALDAFSGLVLTIDLASDEIIVESPKSAATRRSRGRSAAARIATGEDGSSLTLLVRATVPAGAAWLLMDSGNLLGTFLSPALATGLSPDTLGALSIGGESWRTRVVARDVIYDGVLGSSFFREHRVTLDLRDATRPVFIEARRRD